MTNSVLPTPVFIFGAERSGTTMFRLMLDAHKGILNPSETDFLFDYLSPGKGAEADWSYNLDALKNDRIFRALNLNIPDGMNGLDLLGSFVQQMGGANAEILTLNVHRNIERIVQLFPSSNIIHVLRDPRDVARSSIGMGWVGSMYFGVDHWIKTEGSWDRAAKGLKEGQVLELRYEDLFTNTEGELNKVCVFLGVNYDPDMLRFHETTSYSEPNANSVQQWRRKATPRDIALVEGKAQALMQLRGYDLNGSPRVPKTIEKLLLSAKNKWVIWRFGMKKFGTCLFVAEKFSRLMRLKTLNNRLSAKMLEIRIQNLK